MNFKDYILQESINDKYKFKALFVIGIPAAGKSTITKPLEHSATIIDTDNPSELFAHKMNVELTGDDNVPGYKELRKKVKSTTIKKLSRTINNMAPIIATVVGDNINRTQDRIDVLRTFGYEVGMIWLNADLFIAKQRAQQRERNAEDALRDRRKNRRPRYVPTTYIEDAYYDIIIQSNHYENSIIPNVRGELNFFRQIRMSPEGEYSAQAIQNTLGFVEKFFNTPVKTPIANKILDVLKDKKRSMLADSGIFTIEDIETTVKKWFS